MKPLIAAALLAATLTACGGTQEAAAGLEHIEVEDAWVRLPTVPGRPGAAYFHIRTDVAPAALLKVSTPIARRAELHESMKGAGGMMSMTPLKQVTVAADDSLTFAPGGMHAMLFDLNPALKAGGTVPLTLHFASGATRTAKALVVAPGGAAPPSEGRP
jgi:hypothetical protein